MIFPDPKDIVDGEEVTNPTTGVIYVYDQATNSWNVKAEDPVDTGEFATIVYSDAEDAKLKALIDANAAQIEEWANSIASGSYTWNANAVAVGDIASVPSTQGNWSIVTKIAIEPTPIGIGGVSVANMSIGDVISFTSPDDNDYATFEITDTDSANSTIDVTLIDSQGGPAYLSTVMVKHYPQIDTSNFVTNIEFSTAVNDLQDQIDNIDVGADVNHDHPQYSQTSHTHPYSPLSHNHGGDYAEIEHPHDDLKQGIEDLTDSVAELNKAKPHIFKYQVSMPLTDGDFTILGENGLSVGALSDGRSIIWNMTKLEVQEFVKAGYTDQTIKMNEVGDPEEWMVATITSVAESSDWSIDPFYTQGSATGDAEYIFELLPPGANMSDLENAIKENENRINAIEAELEALAETREVGEWQSVSIIDFDIRGSGQFIIQNTDLSAGTNSLTLHTTDANGINHGFSGVEVGDYVEIVQENLLAREVGDFGLWEITSVNGSEFQLQLSKSKGSIDVNSKCLIKFFYVNEAELDMAGMDERYMQKTGNQVITQPWNLKDDSKTYISIDNDKQGIYNVNEPTANHHAATKGYVDTEVGKKANTHSHPYASSGHAHDYAASNHAHSVIFNSGTNTNPTLSKGEPYLNTSYKVIYVGT